MKFRGANQLAYFGLQRAGIEKELNPKFPFIIDKLNQNQRCKIKYSKLVGEKKLRKNKIGKKGVKRRKRKKKD